MLKNPRRERFAQQLARGRTQLEAYKAAGYKADRGNAAALANEREVLERVQQITAKNAERIGVSVASVTGMFLSDREKAYEAKQYNVAVQAASQIAKLHGLMVDRSEIKSLNVSVDLDLLDDSQLEQLQRLLEQAEGAAPVKLPKPESNG